MGKYRDTQKSRFQAEIKYIEGESPDVRHDRRQIENRQQEQMLRNYCRSNGMLFRVLNDGLHWQIKCNKIQIDWWPRTAKMVVNQRWKEGIHVHDVQQLKTYLDFVRLL